MSSHLEQERRFIPLNIAILTISDTRTEETDKSGRLLVERLSNTGHHLYEKVILPDDIYKVRACVARWCADERVQVVIATGGTGLTGRDSTPEAVRPLFDKELPGFGEIFRVISYDDVGTSTIQSRAIAGVSNGTYIFCLPGSTGACATAWDAVIQRQLDYRTRPCNLVELMPRLREV
jgi:molybdenum cofactor biosynthesis protein B